LPPIERSDADALRAASSSAPARERIRIVLDAEAKDSFRQACVNAHWFLSQDDAKAKIGDWKRYYNERRRRSSLQWDTGRFRVALLAPVTMIRRVV
jgi:transposase InsO family protein